MYSIELILHVIYYYKTSNVSLRTLAKNLCLSKSTICRWVEKYGDKINGHNINKEMNITNTNSVKNKEKNENIRT